MTEEVPHFHWTTADWLAFESDNAYQHSTVEDKTEDIQALIRDMDGVLCIAFRGTEWSLKDWRHNIDTTKVEFEAGTAPSLGRVHRGYNRALNSVIGVLLDAVDRALEANKMVYLTGHSAGGALAILLAAHIRDTESLRVYTFGAPPVGDRTFAKLYPHHAFTHRVEYGADMVPRMLAVTYGDVGHCWYIDKRGAVKHNPSWWYLAQRCIFAPTWHRIGNHSIAQYQQQIKKVLQCDT